MTQCTQDDTHLSEQAQYVEPAVTSDAPSASDASLHVSSSSVNNCQEAVTVAAAVESDPVERNVQVGTEAVAAALELGDEVDTEDTVNHDEDRNTTATAKQVLCILYR